MINCPDVIRVTTNGVCQEYFTRMKEMSDGRTEVVSAFQEAVLAIMSSASFSVGEALHRAEGSLMVDLTAMGLHRAQFLKLSGIPLPGLRRRPDGLWEEVPWESYFESPQG